MAYVIGSAVGAALVYFFVRFVARRFVTQKTASLVAAGLIWLPLVVGSLRDREPLDTLRQTVAVLVAVGLVLRDMRRLPPKGG